MELASPLQSLPSGAQRTSYAGRRRAGCLRRSVKRPKLTSADRLLWTWLCEVWSDWRSALVIVKPETVIGWHRKGFRLFWTWKVRHGQPGRPPVSKEIRQLIRKMSRENPLWGAPASTVNCSNSALISARPAWASTSCASGSRRRKPGGPSWRISMPSAAAAVRSIETPGRSQRPAATRLSDTVRSRPTQLTPCTRIRSTPASRQTGRE